MTQTEGNHGGNRRQSQGGRKAEEGIKTSNSQAEALGEGPEANASVEVEISSSPGVSGSMTPVKNDSPGMGLTKGNNIDPTASKRKFKITTSSKLTRASYPIFHRHVTSQGQLSSNNKGKKTNSMTMAPESGTKAQETNTRASAPTANNSTTMAPVLLPASDKGQKTPASVDPAPTADFNNSNPNNSTMMLVTESDLNYSGPNSNNNSMTMVPAPALVVHGESLAPMEGVSGYGSTGNLNLHPPNSNNSTAMVLPAPVAGLKQGSNPNNSTEKTNNSSTMAAKVATTPVPGGTPAPGASTSKLTTSAPKNQIQQLTESLQPQWKA
jgi:hypothetical protein